MVAERTDRHRDADDGARPAILRCVTCRWLTYLDDAIAPTRLGTCVCLRCYLRAVGDVRRLDHYWEREVRTVLTGLTDPLVRDWIDQKEGLL